MGESRLGYQIQEHLFTRIGENLITRIGETLVTNYTTTDSACATATVRKRSRHRLFLSRRCPSGQGPSLPPRYSILNIDFEMKPQLLTVQHICQYDLVRILMEQKWEFDGFIKRELTRVTKYFPLIQYVHSEVANAVRSFVRSSNMFILKWQMPFVRSFIMLTQQGLDSVRKGSKNCQSSI